MQKVQIHRHTALMRCQNELRVVRQRLLERKKPREIRALSFGCSIGEEVASLSLTFPGGAIYGCDIDPRVLRAASVSIGHLAEIFPSDEPEILSHGPFDLIVASAVLCINPRPQSIVTEFPISQYDDILGILDQALNVGGILMIVNACYRFHQSPLFGDYDPIRADVITTNGFVDVFNRDGSDRLVQVGSNGCTYYRKAQFDPFHDEEIADCLFEKRARSRSPAAQWLQVAPVPSAFDAVAEYDRWNTDLLLDDPPNDALRIRERIRLGVDRASELPGYVREVGWPSLVDDHWHARPAYWTPVFD